MAVGWLIRRNVDTAAEIIMFIFSRSGGQVFEHSLEILVKQWLIFIDDDRRCRMLRLHIDPAMSQAVPGDDLIHFVRNVNELHTFAGPQPDQAVVGPDSKLPDFISSCHLVHSVSCVSSDVGAMTRFVKPPSSICGGR